MSNMKHLIVLTTLLLSVFILKAQNAKPQVYGEVGMGAGQTLFSADTKNQLRQALGGAFNPGITSNLIMAFYYAPEKWRGFGIGSRIKGSIATSVKGDFGDSYFFNFYNLAISTKYYAFSKQFNKGWYGRMGVGFGQLTTKRANEDTDSYTHQFAVGNTFTGSIGYSIPLRKTSISFEVEYEGSSRSGTINGVGDQNIRSGQAALNIIYSF